MRNLITFLTRILLRVKNRSIRHTRDLTMSLIKLLLYRVWLSCNKEVSFVKMFSPLLDLLCWPIFPCLLVQESNYTCKEVCSSIMWLSQLLRWLLQAYGKGLLRWIRVELWRNCELKGKTEVTWEKENQILYQVGHWNDRWIYTMGLNSGFHGVKPTLFLPYKVTLHVIMICEM